MPADTAPPWPDRVWLHKSTSGQDDVWTDTPNGLDGPAYVREAAVTAPAWDGMSSIWVLAYELRFPGEEGRWPQAARRSFNTEAEARAYVRSVKGAYQICRVELPSEVTAREAAAWAAGAAAGRSVARECLASFERNASTLVEHLYAEGYREACGHIIALPLPPMPGTTQGGAGDE